MSSKYGAASYRNYSSSAGLAAASIAVAIALLVLCFVVVALRVFFILCRREREQQDGLCGPRTSAVDGC